VEAARRKLRLSVVAAPARVVLTLLAVWQTLVLAFDPPRYVLPSPIDVLRVFIERPEYLARNALVTFGEIVVGFMLGAGFGVGVAILVAAIPAARRMVWPVVLVLQSFPVFVIAPLLVIWFGFGMASKVAMTALIIFFPVASAFADGLRRIDPELRDATALSSATRWQALRRVEIPLALPALVTGLRVAAPLAPLAAVIGEWVGASAGLGFVMVQANARMQTDLMFAAMSLVALCALALRSAVDRLAPALTPWAAESDA
jgi:putative hydroxymethylpyrimidine transport system permease protein